MADDLEAELAETLAAVAADLEAQRRRMDELSGEMRQRLEYVAATAHSELRALAERVDRSVDRLERTLAELLETVASVPEMPRTRTACRDEVVEHRAALRDLGHAHGLSGLRVDDCGTVVVHSSEPGYRAVRQFATEASALVGAWVNTITDDVPAAAAAAVPL